MAYFKIDEPNKPVKWIKDVDRVNGTLTFTENRDECELEKDSGFFADSELSYLKFHFTEDYPEMKYCYVDCDYHWENAPRQQGDVQGGRVQEVPNNPFDDLVEMQVRDAEPQMEGDADPFVEEIAEGDGMPWM